MKHAYIAHDPVEAQLVADQLRAAGIDAVVRVDSLAAPMLPTPSVWVDDDDLSWAELLLHDRGDPLEGTL
ncbi:MAG: DUF2007 domain-containing protein [Gemmatimonadota bacterium]|nr:DUF2007 domain-containing protein [Gemmatimonadota bacterium]